METLGKIEQLVNELADRATGASSAEHAVRISAAIPPLLRELRKANYWVRRGAAKGPGIGG